MEFLPIFPTVLGVDIISCPEIDFNKIKWKKSGSNTINRDIVNNLSEISDNYNVLKDYKDLRFNVNLAIDNYIRNHLGITQEFQVVTSWFTRSKPQTESHLHKHSNSWLSGVLHLTDGGGDIQFERSHHTSQWRSKNPGTYNNNNANVWGFPAKKGRIIIFPSDLEHKIIKNTSRKIRYSLAFNILPLGYFGGGDSGFYWPKFEV